MIVAEPDYLPWAALSPQEHLGSSPAGLRGAQLPSARCAQGKPLQVGGDYLVWGEGEGQAGSWRQSGDPGAALIARVEDELFTSVPSACSWSAPGQLPWSWGGGEEGCPAQRGCLL